MIGNRAVTSLFSLCLVLSGVWCSWGFSPLLFLVLTGLFPLRLRAQVSNDVKAGTTPYETFAGGRSLNNGNLFLHIPLVDYPQRGKLKLSLSLQGSTKKLGRAAQCPVLGGDGCNGSRQRVGRAIVRISGRSSPVQAGRPVCSIFRQEEGRWFDSESCVYHALNVQPLTYPTPAVSLPLRVECGA